MLTTNLDITNLVNTLKSLANSGEKFPVKFSYAIAINIKKLEKYITTIEEERKRIIESLCVKDDDGKPVIDEDTNSYSIPDDKKEELNKSLIELQGVVNKSNLHKVSIDDLPETLEATHVYGLLPMLHESESADDSATQGTGATDTTDADKQVPGNKAA